MKSMDIILVPGLMASAWTLDSLRERLEVEGHKCFSPGFDTQTAVHGELDTLARTLRRLGRAVVIGHSWGGLQGVTLALADNPHIIAVIGLGTPTVGCVRPRAPYFEARSFFGWAVPLVGPTEIKRFATCHALLPFSLAVQNWIVEKLEGLK